MNMQNMNMQNMNMQNIMNNFVKSQTKFVFDPTKLDKQYKKTLINQTITQTKIGMYKSLLKWKSILILEFLQAYVK
jgi:hypothetical protein